VATALRAGILPLFLPIVLAVGPIAILSWSAYRVKSETRAPGATTALLLMALSSLWLAASVGRITNPHSLLASFYENLAATALVLMPTVLVVFAAQYSCDRTFLRARALILLGIEPVLALAFLWLNVDPAQFFLGGTGSLALGASLAVISIMTGWVLLLPIIGLVFVIELVSVILQVGYFKITKGKRLFKMSPFHHHLELSGWPETQVVQRFWLVGLLYALLGIAVALV
jgi:UDP-N-acetylmuramyl pentapeptide phosphotransferase/UDP-N-acetylglucosamine-1-phosphate transferase